MRIDDRFRLLRITDRHVQIGAGPHAVRLDTREPGVRTALHELTTAPGWTGTRAALARRCGLDEAELGRLLERLTPVLDGREEQTGPDGGRDGVRPAGHLPEQVQVVGLGRTGAAVVLALATAGVARIALGDDSPVGAGDLGTGFGARDVGRPRSSALGRRVDELRGGTVCLPCPLPSDQRRSPSGTVRPLGPWLGEATVLVAWGAWDPDLLARAAAAGHPVLPVVLHETGASVGPWCAPGAPGCPLCLERELERADPLRPAQRRALRAVQAGREDVATAQAVAATVTGALRRGPDAGAGRMWLVDDAADGLSRAREVTPWPGCPCAVPTDTWLDDAQAAALVAGV